MRRPTVLLLVGLAAVTTSCASARAARDGQRRAEAAVDAIRYRQPLPEVWDQLRRMLNTYAMPLAPDDLEAIGASGPMGLLVNVFTPAKATARDPVGGQVLETGWVGRKIVRVRYRVWGVEDTLGTRVVITAIEEDTTERGRDSSNRRRAVDLELDLARRLAPDAAQRAEAALAAPGG
jgi:hypothetical protein